MNYLVILNHSKNECVQKLNGCFEVNRLEDKIILLEQINQQPLISQRELSDKTGISIGKINYIINSLVEEGYLICEKQGRKSKYLLTRLGIDYLKNGIKEFQNKKVNIHHKTKKVISQAVILAAGQTKEFPMPVSFMPLGNSSLIYRHIELLKANGINKIVIVTGYKKECFEELSNIEGVILTENPKYKWTGSMASLACVEGLIDDDFILIEHDILTESQAITELIQHDSRDCLLISNESGSGDEAFVEIKNGYIYKISKDIHQMNRIDGEMIGLCKISYELFKNMLDVYKDNKNPYLNYEYLIMDVSRQINVDYLKINDLVWAEIDKEKDYNHVVKTVYPRLMRKEEEYFEHKIKERLTSILDVNYDEIKNIAPFGGMTNKNYKITLANNDEYVLRIPGNGTDEMINRSFEKVNSFEASKLGIDSPLIYFNEQSGVKISRLIRNAETLNPKTAKWEENMILTSGVLRKLHQSDITMPNVFHIYEQILQYETLVDKNHGKYFDGYEETRKHVMEIIDMFEKMNVPFTPCHNDTVPENFVKEGDERIYLIDWEYSGMNDPMWDLAAHSLECGFTEEEEELFLSHYFIDSKVTSEIKLRILMNKIFQDFLWSIWTIFKEAKGDDFGSYGIDRFKRSQQNIQLLLNRGLIYEN